MPYFRKRPVVIEAEQYQGQGLTAFMPPRIQREEEHPDDGFNLYIQTAEGEMRVRPGDWIIRGVAGEFYPCRPDIFEQTYEPADPPPFVRD